MEREPNVILSWKEYHRLIEIEDVFTSLSLSHNEMKNEVNRIGLQLVQSDSKLLKAKDALETIKKCCDTRERLNNKAIENVCNEGLNIEL